jgi:hypothetical protein
MKLIPWHDLTKRASELAGVKVDSLWKPDASGNVKVFSETSLPAAATGTDHLLRCALRRRAMAFDIAGLCSFEALELWTEVLFDELLRDPPPGHRRVTVEQLSNADASLWIRISEACREGTRPLPDGRRPIQEALTTLMYSADVRLLLVPRPGAAAASSAAASSPTSTADAKAQKRIKQLEDEMRQLKRQRAGPAANPPARNSGKASGKGRRTKPPRMPPGLEGKSASTSAGSPICFGFNLGNCAAAQPGGKCPRGLHVCCEPGCEQAHPVKQHPR